MFTAMKPLPHRPGFPVHGLSESFAGFRWLLLWQRRFGPDKGDLTEVQLGHGHPHEGAFVTVATVLKQSARDLGRGSSIGAIGLEYVAGNDVLNAIGQVEPESNHARGTVTDELARIRETDGDVELDEWQSRTVFIDGIAHSGRVRDLGRSQAIVIELADTVISVSGPTDSLPEGWELADVSACLGNYVAGRNESADALFA